MPRISFSFPISDEAVFFAHYDILTQRPTGQNIVSPIDYLFIQNMGSSAISNPNLKPTKTVDYELGFQQVVSRSSSVKISAFYRETRDEIQARRLLEAFPVTYTSFDNYDFGTTKGLTLTYDLRRTGNITLRASYTLQFASATGSSAGSSINLVNSGEPNLRVIFPTDRDQRHVLLATFDFRYGKGKDYNGPVIGGKQILSNSGINIVGNLGSGTPYSQQSRVTGDAFLSQAGSPQLKGTVNGSLLPWQFRINAQIDKSFELTFGKDGEKPKQAFLNVYLLVNNVLNTQNILGVYRFTGNAEDDGYLGVAFNSFAMFHAWGELPGHDGIAGSLDHFRCGVGFRIHRQRLGMPVDADQNQEHDRALLLLLGRISGIIRSLVHGINCGCRDRGAGVSVLTGGSLGHESCAGHQHGHDKKASVATHGAGTMMLDHVQSLLQLWLGQPRDRHRHDTHAGAVQQGMRVRGFVLRGLA